MVADWQDILGPELALPYFQQITAKLAAARAQGQQIYPAAADVMSAFSYASLADTKVVILGQDPYHGPGQAHGLAFSVQPGVAIPPSLRNIYKELALEDASFVMPAHGCLTAWATQGVLLLNSVLTVVAGQANSHQDLGWQRFTDAVIRGISAKSSPVIFLLWGAYAQKKHTLIDQSRHQILTAPHPSPLSAHRGFLGCGHFAKTNQLLQQHRQQPINWQIPAIES